MKISRQLLVLFLCLAWVRADAASYYVDNTVGTMASDANPGTSPSAAWKTIARVNQGPNPTALNNYLDTYKPGDQILFNCGATYSGQLAPKGSGTVGATPNPITITRYGSSGGWPIISNPTTAGGVGATICSGNAAIVLLNQSGWVISRLQITNPYGSAGVDVEINHGAAGGMTYSYIHLDNLIIYDVGDPGVYGTDGIAPALKRAGGGILINNGTGTCVPANFDDVEITNCLIWNIGGIGIQSNANTSSFETTPPPMRMTGSKIDNCVVHECDQDGLIWRAADNATIQNCTVFDTGRAESQSTVGLWIKSSSGTVIENCECYDNTCGNVFADGQGLDLDIDVQNAVVQYCYSHDNNGGFLLLCGCDNSNNFTSSNIVRYNVSQNDSKNLVVLNGRANGNSLYNNTIYSNAAVTTVLGNTSRYDAGAADVFSNNVIWVDTTGTAATFALTADITWTTNTFFGNVTAPAGNSSRNPLFTAAGSGGLGVGSVSGYKLQPTSSEIGTGTAIAGNGGLDYAGIAIPGGSPDRGAFQTHSTAGFSAPNAPAAFSVSQYGAADNGTSDLHLLWTSGSTSSANSEEGFKIERELTSGGSFAQIAVAGGTQVSWIDTSGASGTSYTYRIRGTNSAGDGPYSGTVSIVAP